MDQGSFENNVQDWMNDGFASGWPSASDTNGMTYSVIIYALTHTVYEHVACSA